MGLWCDYQKGDEEGGQVAGKSWELPLVLWAEQKKPVWATSPHQCKLQVYPGTFALSLLHTVFQNLPQDVWRFFSEEESPARSAGFNEPYRK